MLKYKLFMSIASVFFTASPSINMVALNAVDLTKNNVLQTELDEIGIDLSQENESSRKIIAAYKTFNENEHKESYLVFYIHDKELTQTIKTVNVTIKKSAAYESFKMAPSITNRYEAIYFGSTDRVHKYAVKIDYELKNYKYIEFNIGRMTLSDGESISYPFNVTYNNEDYQYTIKDVIELKNTKAGALYLEEHADFIKIFNGSYGKHNVLYGFDIDSKYEINQLQEVEFLYDLYKMEAIAHANINITDGIFIPQAKHTTLLTSKGLFDKDYFESDKFKARNVNYTESEKAFIESYFPQHYELVKSGENKTVAPYDLEVNRSGLFEQHSYKWNSIIKMSELKKSANSDMAKLIENLFPENEYVCTIGAYDVQKSYLSKIPKSERANLNPAKIGDKIHHFFDDDPYRDPRCLWLNDVYDVPIKGSFNSTPGLEKCVYYNTLEPTKIEVVRMKFLDEQENPYDLSVITKPIDVTERVGDPDADNDDPVRNFLWAIIEFFKNLVKFFRENPWAFYLIIAFFLFCIIWPKLSRFIKLFYGG